MKNVLILQLEKSMEFPLIGYISESINRKFPDASIVLLSSPLNEEFVPFIPHLKTVLIEEKRFWRLNKWISQQGFDHIIDLDNTYFSYWLGLLSFTKCVSIPNYKKINEANLLENSPLNKLDYLEFQFDFLKTLGLKEPPIKLPLNLPMVDESIDLPKDYNLFILDTEFHTLSLDYAALVQLFYGLTKPAILLGSDFDNQIIGKRLAVLFPDTIINLCGKVPASNYISYIKNASKVVSYMNSWLYIAAPLNENLMVFLGNSSRELGLFPKHVSIQTFQNEAISCNPCSIVGTNFCKEYHYKCIKPLSLQPMINFLNS